MNSPRDLGLPKKFESWQSGQYEAYELLSKDPRRFQVCQLPTGTGKTAVAMAIAIQAAKEGKFVSYCTATNHLLDQVVEDFREVGLVPVKGMAHYACVQDGGTCDEGSCTDGAACWAKTAGCTYFDAVRAAHESKLRVTNYPFRMSQNPFQDALGNTDLLICDEAHDLAAQVLGYLRIELNDREIQIPSDAELWTHEQWSEWARVHVVAVSQQMKRGIPKWKKKKLDGLKKRLLALKALPESTVPWVIDKTWSGFSFEPLWPAAFMDAHLWRGVKKIILMSATITKPQLAHLGITDYHWISQQSPIPVSQRPVIFYPVADLMAKRVTETDLWRLMEVIDELIGERLDAKILIHTVSYDRMKFVLANSRWKDLMLSHESRGGAEAVQRFKESEPPCILVSPSSHTGVDLVGDAARFQIIMKTPFEPPSALLKARTHEDKSYPYMMALKRIEQMAGRVVRGPKDWGQTVILDSNFGWLMSRHGAKHTTPSFQKAVKEVSEPPSPLRLK